MKLFGLEIKKAPVADTKDFPRGDTRITRVAKRSVTYDNVVAAHLALQHPVVFRCLHKIAMSVQGVEWLCEADPDVPASKRAAQKQIDTINEMLKKPNLTATGEQLRYWMAMTWAVYGRIPFKVSQDMRGVADAVYPLRADKLRQLPDAKGIVTSFKYGTNPEETMKPRHLTGESVGSYCAQIWRPNLNFDHTDECNVNPLAAIGLPTQVTRLLMQRAVDTASGHPNVKYLIAGEKTITENQRRDIIEHLEASAAGEEESGNVLFLSNTSIDVHELKNDLSDIHSKVPLDDMTRMIAGCFGIPIALLGLGAADGAKFASNYTESRMTFWEDTIIPEYLVPIERGMTTALCPTGARIVFDRDTIEAVQESRIRRAKDLSAVTFLTDNEKRAMVGYEATPWGDKEPNPVLPPTTAKTSTP